ncbi:MAG: hypothetical protein ACR2PI_05145 [Hyphomicrobiaceae bacterium]
MENQVSSTKSHTWTFRPRFRSGAFGWRSDLPIKRIKEAIAEIKKVARSDKVLAADGAVTFLEKLSPALQHVDSSSGAIGTAANRALEALVPIIADAAAGDKQRDKWLERLWRAIEDDQIPYMELLPDHWGTLCVTPERASGWADRFIEGVRLAWSPDFPPGGYFKGTAVCLSALHAAGRHDELLVLLELAPHKFWHYRQWGVRALVGLGRPDAAIQYAEDTRGLNQSDNEISLACEDILLSNGKWKEAYDQYAFDANRRSTYLATFQAIAKKYPQVEAEVILQDLIASTPGDEGKWFAAAKSAGFLGLAGQLANQSPCDPKTLMRAARDRISSDADFARSVSLAALKWMLRGYGYELTTIDVINALDLALEAARNGECESETVQRIRELVNDYEILQPSIVQVLRQRLSSLTSSPDA